MSEKKVITSKSNWQHILVSIAKHLSNSKNSNTESTNNKTFSNGNFQTSLTLNREKAQKHIPIILNKKSGKFFKKDLKEKNLSVRDKKLCIEKNRKTIKNYNLRSRNATADKFQRTEHLQNNFFCTCGSDIHKTQESVTTHSEEIKHVPEEKFISINFDNVTDIWTESEFHKSFQTAIVTTSHMLDNIVLHNTDLNTFDKEQQEDILSNHSLESFKRKISNEQDHDFAIEKNNISESEVMSDPDKKQHNVQNNTFKTENISKVSNCKKNNMVKNMQTVDNNFLNQKQPNNVFCDASIKNLSNFNTSSIDHTKNISDVFLKEVTASDTKSINGTCVITADSSIENKSKNINNKSILENSKSVNLEKKIIKNTASIFSDDRLIHLYDYDDNDDVNILEFDIVFSNQTSNKTGLAKRPDTVKTSIDVLNNLFDTNIAKSSISNKSSNSENVSESENVQLNKSIKHLKLQKHKRQRILRSDRKITQEILEYSSENSSLDYKKSSNSASVSESENVQLTESTGNLKFQKHKRKRILRPFRKTTEENLVLNSDNSSLDYKKSSNSASISESETFQLNESTRNLKHQKHKRILSFNRKTIQENVIFGSENSSLDCKNISNSGNVSESQNVQLNKSIRNLKLQKHKRKRILRSDRKTKQENLVFSSENSGLDCKKNSNSSSVSEFENFLLKKSTKNLKPQKHKRKRILRSDRKTLQENLVFSSDNSSLDKNLYDKKIHFVTNKEESNEIHSDSHLRIQKGVCSKTLSKKKTVKRAHLFPSEDKKLAKYSKTFGCQAANSLSKSLTQNLPKQYTKIQNNTVTKMQSQPAIHKTTNKGKPDKLLDANRENNDLTTEENQIDIQESSNTIVELSLMDRTEYVSKYDKFLDYKNDYNIFSHDKDIFDEAMTFANYTISRIKETEQNFIEINKNEGIISTNDSCRKRKSSQIEHIKNVDTESQKHLSHICHKNVENIMVSFERNIFETSEQKDILNDFSNIESNENNSNSSKNIDNSEMKFCKRKNTISHIKKLTHIDKSVDLSNDNLHLNPPRSSTNINSDTTFKLIPAIDSPKAVNISGKNDKNMDLVSEDHIVPINDSLQIKHIQHTSSELNHINLDPIIPLKNVDHECNAKQISTTDSSKAIDIAATFHLPNHKSFDSTGAFINIDSESNFNLIPTTNLSQRINVATKNHENTHLVSKSDILCNNASDKNTYISNTNLQKNHTSLNTIRDSANINSELNLKVLSITELPESITVVVSNLKTADSGSENNTFTTDDSHHNTPVLDSDFQQNHTSFDATKISTNIDSKSTLKIAPTTVSSKIDNLASKTLKNTDLVSKSDICYNNESDQNKCILNTNLKVVSFIDLPKANNVAVSKLKNADRTSKNNIFSTNNFHTSNTEFQGDHISFDAARTTANIGPESNLDLSHTTDIPKIINATTENHENVNLVSKRYILCNNDSDKNKYILDDNFQKDHTSLNTIRDSANLNSELNFKIVSIIELPKSINVVLSNRKTADLESENNTFSTNDSHHNTSVSNSQDHTDFDTRIFTSIEPESNLNLAITTDSVKTINVVTKNHKNAQLVSKSDYLYNNYSDRNKQILDGNFQKSLTSLKTIRDSENINSESNLKILSIIDLPKVNNVAVSNLESGNNIFFRNDSHHNTYISNTEFEQDHTSFDATRTSTNIDSESNLNVTSTTDLTKTIIASATSHENVNLMPESNILSSNDSNKKSFVSNVGEQNDPNLDSTKTCVNIDSQLNLKLRSIVDAFKALNRAKTNDIPSKIDSNEITNILNKCENQCIQNIVRNCVHENQVNNSIDLINNDHFNDSELILSTKLYKDKHVQQNELIRTLLRSPVNESNNSSSITNEKQSATGYDVLTKKLTDVSEENSTNGTTTMYSANTVRPITTDKETDNYNNLPHITKINLEYGENQRHFDNAVDLIAKDITSSKQISKNYCNSLQKEVVENSTKNMEFLPRKLKVIDIVNKFKSEIKVEKLDTSILVPQIGKQFKKNKFVSPAKIKNYGFKEIC